MPLFFKNNKMKNILPLFELTIDGEDSFVEKIALVENPAIVEKFLLFSKQKDLVKFIFSDDKKELFGPAMIPELPIYRRDEDGYEYNVFFSSDTIKQIEKVYFKKGFQSNINIEHSPTNTDSYVFESLIIDRANGIAPTQFPNLPDGSWLIKAKVENDGVWKDIKSGKRNGFSVEGVFTLLNSKFSDIKESEELDELLQSIKDVNKLLESINF